MGLVNRAVPLEKLREETVVLCAKTDEEEPRSTARGQAWL